MRLVARFVEISYRTAKDQDGQPFSHEHFLNLEQAVIGAVDADGDEEQRAGEHVAIRQGSHAALPEKPGTHAAQRADRIFPALNHRANVDCDHQGAP
jgi:hypothetical protein